MAYTACLYHLIVIPILSDLCGGSQMLKHNLVKLVGAFYSCLEQVWALIQGLGFLSLMKIERCKCLEQLYSSMIYSTDSHLEPTL